MTDWAQRARDLIPGMGQKTVPMSEFFDELEKAVLQLGREMADERAEEIVAAIDALRADHGADQRGWIRGLRDSAKVALSTIHKKTREQVLEEALQEIEKVSLNEFDRDELNRKRDLARRALEWKP